MGVPSFYKWLVRKYPKIILDAKEEGVLEFDNLYLDMTEIFFLCFRLNDEVPSQTLEEFFSLVYEYIDRLVNFARPRKLLFMALDGVAPLAKMNEQRARGFRRSKDRTVAKEMEEKLRQQFEKLGKTLLPKEESEGSGSLVIAPGTKFMYIMSKKLEFYIMSRMRENQAWGNLKVILSNDRVPGEAEHKIMSFIRAQRSLPGYDPNTKHCLYGLDADLIMLALVTHEVHFLILREARIVNQHNQNSSLDHSQQKVDFEKSVPLQFLNIWVLREYLELDFCGICPDNDFDLERIIDDFIFICFFIGNDFLPHIPSLEAHEGCIDLLMHIYKEEFKNLGGYIVDMQRVDDKNGSYINLERVEWFILLVGAYEEKIFDKRLELRDRQLNRIIAEYNNDKEAESIALDDERSSDIVNSFVGNEMFSQRAPVLPDRDELYRNTIQLEKELEDILEKKSDLFKAGDMGTDKVKFGKQGWKERYYKVKFNAQSPDEAEEIRKSLMTKYCEGLCWTLLYYFSGVPSWPWFYPYHYGPLASDCKGLSQVKVKFEKGLPFTPFEHLMGILPPSSAGALPAAYEVLMTDQNSPIIDFYPTEFETDMDGKRFSWQGICKLPFIEEARLLAETSKLESELEDHEKVRNTETVNQMFLRCPRQPSYDEIMDAIKTDFIFMGVKKVHLISRDNTVEVDGVSEGHVMLLFFEVKEEVRLIPRPLEGVNIPEKTVSGEDISKTILWHESHGRKSSHFKRPQNRMPTGQDAAMPSSSGTFRGGAGWGFSSGKGQSRVNEYKRDYQPTRQRFQPSSTMPDSSGKFGGAGRGLRGKSHANEYKRDFQPFVRKTECNWRSGQASKSSKMECREDNKQPESFGTLHNVSNTNPNSFWPSRRNLSHGNSSESWRSVKPQGGIHGNSSGETYAEGRGQRSKPNESVLDNRQHAWTRARLDN